MGTGSSLPECRAGNANHRCQVSKHHQCRYRLRQHQGQKGIVGDKANLGSSLGYCCRGKPLAADERLQTEECAGTNWDRRERSAVRALQDHRGHSAVKDVEAGWFFSLAEEYAVFEAIDRELIAAERQEQVRFGHECWGVEIYGWHCAPTFW